MMRKILLAGAFSFLVLLVVLMGAWVHNARSSFQKRANKNYTVYIYPEKYRFVTEKEVIQIIRQHDIKDTTEVARAKIIESVLEKNPFIDNAEAYVGSQGRLTVEIEQFEPVIYMEFEGEEKIMTTKGSFMPIPKHYKPKIPVFEGMVGMKELPGVYYVIIQLHRDPFFKNRLYKIIYKDLDIHLKLYGFSPEINLGEPTAYRIKLEKTKDIIRVLKQQNKERLYKQVDVSYQGQIICKK